MIIDRLKESQAIGGRIQGWEQYNQIDDIMLFLGHQLQFPKTASG